MTAAPGNSVTVDNALTSVGEAVEPGGTGGGEVVGKGASAYPRLRSTEAEADERTWRVVQRRVEGEPGTLVPVAAGDVVDPGELHPLLAAGALCTKGEGRRQVVQTDAGPEMGDRGHGHFRVGGSLFAHVLGEPGHECEEVFGGTNERAHRGVDIEEVREVAKGKETPHLVGVSRYATARVAPGERRDGSRRRRSDEVQVKVGFDKRDELILTVASRNRVARESTSRTEAPFALDRGPSVAGQLSRRSASRPRSSTLP